MKLPILMLVAVLLAPAQDAAKFFHLDFVVKELDDTKIVSARKYSMFTTTDEKLRGGSIRTGNKVSFNNGQNFVDVGVNIDVQLAREVNGQLVLMLVADISSIPSDASLALVRQNKWVAAVTVPFGKATTLFSSDDQNSKRKMQLEVTATSVK